MKKTDAKRLSLKQVRVIDAVARSRGFAEAAAMLNSSQPVVSRTIAAAEKLFGRPIFQRGWSGTEPTAWGEAVIERCANALKLIARAETDLAATGPHPDLAVVLRWHHLDAVAAVTSCGGTTGAAGFLAVSQPAISKSLAAISACTPHPLFLRKREGLEATPHARRLAALRDELRQALGTAGEITRSPAGRLGGRLAVGMLPFSGQALVARTFGGLTGQAPDLRLMAVPGSYHMLAEALRRGEIDCMIGILRRPPPFPDLQERFLYHETYTLVARHDHPCHRRHLTMASLKNEQWIVAPHGTPIRAFFESLFANEGAAPPAQTCEILSFGNAEQVIMNSQAIGLLAYGERQLLDLHPELKKLDIDLPGARVDVGLTVRTQAGETNVLQVFEKTLQDFLK
ncbi:LysR family transcriptional regulator [Roseibium marinum]|uniref:DNA-binding transcriptional LysR family regulator n=1 Tax=Roseibium marinum TaxID=281252 RepID=A0A2S3UT45_9HYPH|nr:LysR substrate-binding domain-containing protein [Roseibium marinum]POF30898.1 DNA-binding transcriptional LysR family regulator [Roseibium marinum]